MPGFRKTVLQIKKSYEQTIDTVSKDQLLEAGLSGDARARAVNIVQSFEKFIQENKDEITALQVLYSRPYKQRLTFQEIRELADAIQRPPRAWTSDLLWRAYETLDKSKVRGSGARVLSTSFFGPFRSAPEGRAAPLPRAGSGEIRRLARRSAEQRPHLHRGTAPMARTDPRSRRIERRNRHGGF